MRKPLSKDSSYYTRYDESMIKDMAIIKKIGKMEDSSPTNIVFDDIVRDILPWRGGTITVNNFKCNFCAHLELWMSNANTNILSYLMRTNLSLKEEDKSIYVWIDKQ